MEACLCMVLNQYVLGGNYTLYSCVKHAVYSRSLQVMWFDVSPTVL